MTERRQKRNLIFMRCLMLWALAAAVVQSRLPAQRVPARDLLKLPVGSMDRAAALGNSIGDGIGNPAAILLDNDIRARVGAIALRTPSEQGVSAQVLAFSLALPGNVSGSLSAMRASVADIFRTETDPQTTGQEIDYGTTVYSAAIARRQNSYFTPGLAVRYRTGELDGESRGAFGLDAGIVIDLAAFRSSKIGVSSFLWRPAKGAGEGEDEATTLHAAGDFRAFGSSPVREARAGYGLSLTEGDERQDQVFASGRYDLWEGRAGLVRTEAFGSASWRARLAVLVYYHAYTVGVAREQNTDDLDAMYQFTLSTVIR
ncbi:MAG: hypothetical protein ABR543_06690 [Gemmatimonadaceae bacterium]